MSNKSFWAIISLTLGHLVTDLQAGALPIVLPHLKEMFSLTYAQMAAIVLTQNVTSSVIQPVFGYITDKRSLPTFLPFCAALAGAGFSAIGWATSYAMILMTVIIIGVSSATYHPQASKTVNFLSADNAKAQNMGIFSLGGKAGMAVGSMMMTFLLALEGGIHNTMYFVLPGLLVFGLMMYYMPEYKRVNIEFSIKQATSKIKKQNAKLSYFGLFLLLFFIFLRSTVHTGLSTYLPSFFMKFRDCEPVFASLLVTVFLLGGVVGTYLGAVISDKLGTRAVVFGSMLLSILPVFMMDKIYNETIIIVNVGLAGFLIVASSAASIVLAQTMLPNNVGMAAGLTIGFSVGLGGLGVTGLGVLADNFGLPFTMQVMCLLTVVCALVALKLPIPASLRKKF
ncbi:MAG: MFS transporter [Phascolarctobacterium sp.]|nr:MFS transporter [Phascolarctobacterium sp.]